jgi:mono/diheme cytochrome c family protein
MGSPHRHILQVRLPLSPVAKANGLKHIKPDKSGCVAGYALSYAACFSRLCDLQPGDLSPGDALGLGVRGIRLILAALLLLTVSACGGLAGEPRIVGTSPLPTVTPTAPPDLGHPPARVNLAHGADIFGGPQGCANCHGISGKGDGQTASSFTCALPNFSDATATRSQTINAWFAITTNGNGGATSCLMPPWKNVLNEQQRWDVTSYIYSLHYTSDQLTQGQQLWQDKCAACHGQTGAGDGPRAKDSARPVPNFADPAALIGYSDTYLYNTVTNGLGSAMPSFKDQLSDDQRWATIAYARSLSWEGTVQSQAATQTATEAATPAVPDSPTVTVKGKVSNGTSGASAFPAGQTFTLRIIDNSSGTLKDAETRTTKTIEGGSFSFGEVKRYPNFVYVVIAEYGGLQQISNPVRLVPGSGPTLDLSFTVYESTSDPKVIQIEVERIFLAPFSANTLLVREGLRFRNSSDRLYLNGQNSVQVQLPSGAQQIQLDNAAQYTVRDGPAPTILGNNPVYPGEENATALQFSYLLPFTPGQEITSPTLYPVEQLSIYLPQTSGLTISDPTFVRGESVTLDDGVYNTFNFQNGVQAGRVIRLPIKGQAEQAADQRNVLAVVLFIAGIVIALTILAAWRLSRQSPPPVSPSESVIQAIADLDSRFEAGKIPLDEYERERERLKAEAARLLE